MRSNTVARLIFRCSWRSTSSSVESMLSSPSASSITASAARRPSVWIRSRMRSPNSRSISSVTLESSHFAFPA
jgi:hypothetical protein